MTNANSTAFVLAWRLPPLLTDILRTEAAARNGVELIVSDEPSLAEAVLRANPDVLLVDGDDHRVADHVATVEALRRLAVIDVRDHGRTAGVSRAVIRMDPSTELSVDKVFTVAAQQLAAKED